MTTYLVTRHPATRLWANVMAKHKRLPFAIDQTIEHLDVDALVKGDVVVGTLPVHLAAELYRRKIAFWSLDLDVPVHDRGKELTAVHLVKYGARLTRYEVREKDAERVAAAPGKATEKPEAPSVTLVPVSAQLAPAAIGWLHQPTAEIWLLASDAMKLQAKSLKTWFESRPDAPRVVVRKWLGDNYADLLTEAERWATDLAGEACPTVVLNLTGGTKPMSMALQRAFGKRLADFSSVPNGQYVDTEHHQLGELLHEPASTSPLRSVLNLADLLALHGASLVSAQSSAPGYVSWLEREALFSVLLDPKAQAWLGSWYRILGQADWLVNSRKNFRGKRISIDADKAFDVEWIGERDVPDFLVTVRNPHALNWKGLKAALQGRFGKALKQHDVCTFGVSDGPSPVLNLHFDRSSLDELAFASGTWLEAWLAREFAAADVDDWAQGVTIKRGGAENEFDLMAVCGNQTLMVEVKTANLTREGREESKGAEAVYKFDSVTDKLGQHFNQRWLASLRELSPQDQERASRHRITVFHGGRAKDGHVKTLADLPKAVRDWAKRCRLERDPTLARAEPPAPPAVA